MKIDGFPAINDYPGLERADVVFEFLVEGGVTRFLAVYHSEYPDVTGPVRSLRTSDLFVLPSLLVLVSPRPRPASWEPPTSTVAGRDDAAAVPATVGT